MQLSDHTQHGLQSLNTTLKVKRATLQTIIISVHITSSKHLRDVICIEVIAYLQIFLKVQKTLAITILELLKGGGGILPIHQSILASIQRLPHCLCMHSQSQMGHKMKALVARVQVVCL